MHLIRLFFFLQWPLSVHFATLHRFLILLELIQIKPDFISAFNNLIYVARMIQNWSLTLFTLVWPSLTTHTQLQWTFAVLPAVCLKQQLRLCRDINLSLAKTWKPGKKKRGYVCEKYVCAPLAKTQISLCAQLRSAIWLLAADRYRRGHRGGAGLHLLWLEWNWKLISIFILLSSVLWVVFEII